MKSIEWNQVRDEKGEGIEEGRGITIHETPLTSGDPFGMQYEQMPTEIEGDLESGTIICIEIILIG